MALGSLPPWLNINPQQYLSAVESGQAMGQRIAEQAQQAWENDQRMKMAQAQQEIQNAANRLAADRLEAYRQAELENAAQGLGLRGEGLDIQRQRAQDMLALGEARNQESANRLAALEEQRNFMNEMRSREADRRDSLYDLRERELNRARQGHYFTGGDGKTYVVKPGETEATEVKVPEEPEPPQTDGYWSNLAGALFGRPRLSAPAITNEVTRITSDGRKAIFDSRTKQFLRYAD